MNYSRGNGFLHPTENGVWAVTGSTGVASFYGTGTRAVVAGNSCKVCEVNTVFVMLPQVADLGHHGTVTIAAYSGDANPTDTIHSVSVSSEYETSPAFDFAEWLFKETFFSATNPWEDTVADFSIADEFVLHAAPRAGNTLSATQLPFIAQTISCSFLAQEFVSTLPVPGLFLCYAGADFVMAGTSGVDSATVRDITHFRTNGIAATPEYVDAKPLRTPYFVFTCESFPQESYVDGQTFTTLPAGAQSLVAARVGAIDVLQSPPSTGPVPSRDFSPCYLNNRTFGQYQSSPLIFRDSQFLAYAAQVKLELLAPEVATGRTGSFAVEDLDGSFMSTDKIRFDIFPSMRFRAYVRNAPIRFLLAGLNVESLSIDEVVLSHSLHDGRATAANEWHYAGEWPGQTLSGRAGSIGFDLTPVRYTHTIQDFNEAFAQQRLQDIQSVDTNGVYVIDARYFRRPRKLQARLHFTPEGGGFVNAFIHYRIVWAVEFELERMPFTLFSASRSGRTVTWQYGLDGEPELAATHSYVGHSYWSERAIFTPQQWQSLTMSGDRVVSNSGRVALQFV